MVGHAGGADVLGGAAHAIWNVAQNAEVLVGGCAVHVLEAGGTDACAFQGAADAPRACSIATYASAFFGHCHARKANLTKIVDQAGRAVRNVAHVATSEWVECKA